MTTPNFDWLSSFTTAFDPASASAQATVNSLVVMGTSLFWAIATLYMGFLGLKIMLEDGPMAQLGELINAFLVIGMIFWALQMYPTMLGYMNTGFSQVAAKIAGGTGATDLVWSGFQKIMSQALLIYNTMPGLPDISVKDIFDLKNSSKLLTTWGVDLVASVLAMLCMTGSAVLFLIIYSYSLLMFMVGAVVGPILLPWYLLSPFRFAAEGWMRFMISAGMYRVVAIAIIAVLSPFLHQMQSVMSDQAAFFSAGTTADRAMLQAYHMFFSVAVLIFSIGILYMLTKVPEIVSGLLSGGGGAGLRFGGGPKWGGKDNSTPRGEKNDTSKNIESAKAEFNRKNL